MSYAIKKLRDYLAKSPSVIYPEDVLAYLPAIEAENAKLRELADGLRYCANEAYGMCARVPVGGERPFTCCPLYDFDSKEYGCKKLMRELGIEVDA